MSSLSYATGEFVKELILQGNAAALENFFTGVLPYLDGDCQEKFETIIQTYAPSSPNEEIRSKYVRNSEITSDAAFFYILNAMKGELPYYTEKDLRTAIAKLKENSLRLCMELTNNHFKYDNRPDAENHRIERSLVIEWICEAALKENIKQESFTSYGYGSKSFDTKITNRALAKLCKLLEVNVNKSSYYRDSLDYLKSEIGLGDIDNKLSVTDLPVLRNGKIVNPELLLAAKELELNLHIPILHRIEDVCMFDSRQIKTTRIPRSELMIMPRNNREKDEFQFISANTNFMRDAHFYAMADLPLVIGLSVPEDIAISLVNLEHLETYDIDNINEQRLSEMMDNLESLWVNPIVPITREPSSKDEIISINSLLEIIEGKNEFELYKAACRVDESFLVKLANVFTSIQVDPAKTSNYDTYDRRLNNVIRMFNGFGILPDSGSVFLKNIESIERLFKSGFKLKKNSDFFISNAMSRGYAFSLDALRKLADIGGYVGLKDMPENAAQALKYAKSRPSQLMHTAYLRHFEFDELMREVKDPSYYTILIKAFPEKSEILIPHLTDKDKRMVLTQDLNM